MPEDTEMYKSIISRLSPEQAKNLAEEMDMMQRNRFIVSLVWLLGMIILGIFLIVSSKGA